MLRLGEVARRGRTSLVEKARHRSMRAASCVVCAIVSSAALSRSECAASLRRVSDREMASAAADHARSAPATADAHRPLGPCVRACRYV